MHYYQHHIGDFIKDTANLNDHQLSTYMRMVWTYYSEEKPFANEPEDIAFAMRSDEKTVCLILRHYFKEAVDGWRHSRCDREIAEFHGKKEKASASANARWINAKNKANAKQPQSERNANASKSDANQEPITNNQVEDQKPSSPSGDGKPVKPDPLQGFGAFWIKYPRKTAKQDAEKAWAKLKPDADLQATLITAVDRQAKSLDWTKDSGKFIPHPATWLNGKRWDDQLTAAPLSKHGDFEKRDYYDGLTQREDGSYAF